MPTTSTLLNGGEPPIANSFLFEVDGVEIGIFREVKGLELTVTVQEIPEGGQNGFVHKMPGRVTWPNIVFKRGMTQGDAMFDWMSKTSGTGFAGNNSKLTRCTGAVSAISAVGVRLRSWEIIDAYPVKWRGPEFNTDSRIPLEEELEIAHHGFTSKTYG